MFIPSFERVRFLNGNEKKSKNNRVNFRGILLLIADMCSVIDPVKGLLFLIKFILKY